MEVLFVPEATEKAILTWIAILTLLSSFALVYISSHGDGQA